MRCLNRLATFVLFVAWMPGVALNAQTSGSAPSNKEEEDLRQTVRELALRVTALEEELHRERNTTAAPAPTTSIATLKPIAMPMPAVDVRNSVESVSSSGEAFMPVAMPATAAPAPVTTTTQTTGTASAPVISP